MFHTLKQQVAQHFRSFASQLLFTVEIDRSSLSQFA